MGHPYGAAYRIYVNRGSIQAFADSKTRGLEGGAVGIQIIPLPSELVYTGRFSRTQAVPRSAMSPVHG